MCGRDHVAFSKKTTFLDIFANTQLEMHNQPIQIA